MQWTDSGIILGVRRLGEAHVVLELMTREHGRHFGLVRGGRSRRLAATLQPGNGVTATWQARLDDQLGTYAVEGTELRAARFIGSAFSLYAINVLAVLLRLLPERDPHESLHEALHVIVEHLDAPSVAAPLIVRFELALLAELGFGLDLTQCAATGATQELSFVSPKSGRAVSRRAGEAYADRLLALPAFAREGFLAMDDAVAPSDLRAGFALSGYFLERHVFGPRGMAMPDTRAAMVAAVAPAARN